MDASKNISPAQRSDSDAEIGHLLYKTAKTLKNLALWIVNLFLYLGKALLIFLFFLRRNIIWLGLGTIIGMAYGIYLEKRNGVQYFAEMNVQANFNSAAVLYNSLDYFNALIGAGQTAELSRLLSITPGEAGQLTTFYAEPIKSELIAADLYKEHFLLYDRSMRVRQDTFWIRTLGYKDFKQSLTNFDYPFHKISVISANPNIFLKLQKGLIDYASGNTLLKNLQKRQASVNEEEENLILSSIKNLDSLRQAYNQRLIKSQPASGSNQLTVMESTQENKPAELELYDKVLQLNDELKKSRRRSSTQIEIFSVYSPFNPVGRKLSIFRQTMTRFAIIGLCLSLISLLLVAVYKSLSALEKSTNIKKKQAPANLP